MIIQWLQIAWDFIKKPNTRSFALVGVAVILSILYLNSCGNNKVLRQTNRILKKKNKQNEAALSQQMEIVNNKQQELVYQKALYQGKVKDIRRVNDSLYTELKKEKGKVEIITKFKTKWKSPEVTVDNKLKSINDTTKGLQWIHETDYRLIKGLSTFHINKDVDGVYSLSSGTTTILKDNVSLDLVVGVKEQDDIKKIFVTPKTPGVTIGNLQGAIIEDQPLPSSKPKRHGIGVSMGYGIMPVAQNDAITLQTGPTINLSYNFSVIRF